MNEIIFKYLNRNYYIKDLGIYTTEGQPQFISDIGPNIELFFGMREYDVYLIIKDWLLNNGFDNENYSTDLYREKIGDNLPYSEELFITSQYKHEIVNYMKNGILKYFEFHEYELVDLNPAGLLKLRYIKELIPFMKALGFRLMEENEMEPDGIKNGFCFYEMTYNEWINERQNNPYWKDWLRAKEHDEKAQLPSLLEADSHGLS
jgi:hypothetical protein